ncbi:hypothetical protein [Spirulina sp. 06S082]|nr:hypothetical protein [Spirulina sp. 06S082]MEA5471972.1 hypothetical protein [Spirulina sp. 06S082]
MNAIIIILTLLLAVAGCSVSIWSIIDTRNKYYQDYLNRKRKNQ